jgi:hypothetical protein
MWTLGFESLGVGIRVTWESLALTPVLRALTACYAPLEREATLDYRMSGSPPYELRRNGQVIHRSSELDELPPVFELDLYAAVVRQANSAGWVLHAAGAVRNAQAIVLFGESGTGKSTLVHALVERGSSYLSDEWVLVRSGGQAAGVARPITREVNAPAPAEPWSNFRYVLHAPDGTPVESLLSNPPAASLWRAPCAILALVHLTSERYPTAELEPLGSVAALAACLESTLHGNSESAVIALRVLGNTPVFRLRAGPVAESSELVQRLWLGCQRPAVLGSTAGLGEAEG